MQRRRTMCLWTIDGAEVAGALMRKQCVGQHPSSVENAFEPPAGPLRLVYHCADVRGIRSITVNALHCGIAARKPRPVSIATVLHITTSRRQHQLTCTTLYQEARCQQAKSTKPTSQQMRTSI